MHACFPSTPVSPLSVRVFPYPLLPFLTCRGNGESIHRHRIFWFRAIPGGSDKRVHVCVAVCIYGCVSSTAGGLPRALNKQATDSRKREMCFLVYRADLVCREFERSTANQLSRYRINEKKIPFLERVAQMSTVFLQQRKESISLIDVRLFRSTVSIEVTRWFLRTVRAWRFVLQLRQNFLKIRSKKSSEYLALVNPRLWN